MVVRHWWAALVLEPLAFLCGVTGSVANDGKGVVSESARRSHVSCAKSCLKPSDGHDDCATQGEGAQSETKLSLNWRQWTRSLVDMRP